MIFSAHGVSSPVRGLRQPSRSKPTRLAFIASPCITNPTPSVLLSEAFRVASSNVVQVEDLVELAYFCVPTIKGTLPISPSSLGTNFQWTQFGMDFKSSGT